MDESSVALERLLAVTEANLDRAGPGLALDAMRNAASVTDLTAERIQRNNRVFREANERIHDSVQRYDHEIESIPFLCECPVEDCVEIVPLTEVQYLTVRADPSHYLTAVGHEGAEEPVGRVISRKDGYVVVKKP